MRIVVGSLQQETNSFSPIRSVYEDFDVVYGDRMLEKIAATGVFRQAGVELIPALYANAVPSGKLDEESFNRFKNELVDSIPAGKKPDGIWLYLHGAMEVKNIGSGEVALLSAIREKVGLDLPVALALDFHANNSAELAELANIICGYRTAPHTDMKETQVRAAELLLYCIKEETLPKPVLVRVPLMVTGDKVITAEEPMKSILTEIEKMEKSGDILSASVFNGQNWVDAANTGASIVVIPGQNRDLALSCAKHIAKMFWDSREKFRFRVEALEPEDAVDLAAGAREDTVFITDSGDNTTAGAAGDSAYLLSILIKKKVQKTLVGGITDSHAVNICEKHDVGDKVDLMLGAELDAEKSKKVEICGIIKGKGRILGWDGEDTGKAVIISIPGIDIIITEERCALISPEIFRSAGVNILDYKIIIVKQGYLYPELAEISKRTILALTPGSSCEAIEKLEFHKIKRPMYPIDNDFEWDP